METMQVEIIQVAVVNWGVGLSICWGLVARVFTTKLKRHFLACYFIYTHFKTPLLLPYNDYISVYSINLVILCELNNHITLANYVRKRVSFLKKKLHVNVCFHMCIKDEPEQMLFSKAQFTGPVVEYG